MSALEVENKNISVAEVAIPIFSDPVAFVWLTTPVLLI